MANLTNIEKRRIEDAFGMSSGYVLDFTNRTFAEFFTDIVKVDIYDSKFDYESGSKANRLRAFWALESSLDVAVVLESLVEIGEYEGILEAKQIEFICKTAKRLRCTIEEKVDSYTIMPIALNSSEKESGDRRYEVALSFAGEQRPYVAIVAEVLKTAGVS